MYCILIVSLCDCHSFIKGYLTWLDICPTWLRLLCTCRISTRHANRAR